MYIAIVIFTFIVSAIFCHFVARNRNANVVFWGVMGGVFGPLAIPFVFLSKSRNDGL
ncbi:MAG: hypothetical protein ACQ9ET_02490 [Nitrosomonadaceae bacterium]